MGGCWVSLKNNIPKPDCVAKFKFILSILVHHFYLTTLPGALQPWQAYLHKFLIIHLLPADRSAQLPAAH